MRVLAEVHELDDRRARTRIVCRESAKKNSFAVTWTRAGPRAGGRAEAAPAASASGRERRGDEPHLSSVGRWYGAAPGMSGFASVSSHCSSSAA